MRLSRREIIVEALAHLKLHIYNTKES